MRRPLVSFAMFLLLFGAHGAQAADNLTNAHNMGPTAARLAIMHDDCVKKGLVKSNIDAQKEFESLVNKIRSGENKQNLPAGTIPEQAADSMQKSYDSLKGQMAQNPPPLDKQSCEILDQKWPQIAKQFGLE